MSGMWVWWRYRQGSPHSVSYAAYVPLLQSGSGACIVNKHRARRLALTCADSRPQEQLVGA